MRYKVATKSDNGPRWRSLIGWCQGNANCRRRMSATTPAPSSATIERCFAAVDLVRFASAALPTSSE
jgi:hypothetical protein